jgi:CheY-like chemotaxis protein
VYHARPAADGAPRLSILTAKGTILPMVMRLDSSPAVLEALPHPQAPWRPRAGDDDPLRHDASRLRPPAESPTRDPAPDRAHLPTVLIGLRVVVVDDDEDTGAFFAVALNACGAVTMTATTAREALRLTIETRPDVILSDIAMAGEDGYWLVNEIRRHPDEGINRVPVVAATAYGREHSRVRTLAAGFRDHLQKPVDPELLCWTVARAAGRPGRGPLT